MALAKRVVLVNDGSVSAFNIGPGLRPVASGGVAVALPPVEPAD